MVALRDPDRLGDDLDRLAGALEDLRLPRELSYLGTERYRLSRTIREYLIPRAEDPEIPLTVVFAGPTGSGKSTLINSLTGLELSVAGPLRPTTTGPIVLTSEDRRAELDHIAGVRCLVVAGAAPILESMVLVDTPDIDSTSLDHRKMAEAVIDDADVVIFVTSALRYADAVPWQILRRAESRGSDVIHVLNRISSSTRGAVVDFRARLRAAGLSDEVVTVPEHRTASQALPPVAVRSLRRQLASLAGERDMTKERVFERVLDATIHQIGALEAELREASDSRDASREEMVAALGARVDSLDLSGVAGGLVAPVGGTAREAKRWRRSARRDPLTTAEVDDIVGALEARIERDLRIWLAEPPASTIGHWVEPGRAVSGVAPVARLALEGWIDFVRRIARDEAARSAGLAESVLVESATDPSDDRAARTLFGDRAREVVGRARRELKGRLEIIYDQAGAYLTELMELDSGTVDRTDLRAALAAVRSSFATVDA